MTLLKSAASNYLLDTSREYSIYVCSNRAIPRVTDGLKNGQRQALWLMRNRTDKIKVMALTGEMMLSELYVHGDASANNLISLMAAPYCNNIPLLKGVGTFGTRVAPVEGIGAARYVSVKRGIAANNLIYRDLNIVELKDNHDGSNKEPITFLPIIPTVLLNGIAGIAVGWATTILPRNIDDIIKATVAAIDGKRIPKLIPTYDYFDVTAAPVHGKPNAWDFSGKVEFVNASTLKVTELPPDMTLNKFRNNLTILENDGKIMDFTDRSTKNINVEIKFKRGTIKDWTEEQAIKFLKLTTRKNEKMVVIDWDGNSIREYEDTGELVQKFVEWRFGFYIKRYERLRDDTADDINFWKAVKLCYDDDLPSRLTKIANRKGLEDEIRKITKTISLTDEQVDRITNFASYRWTKDGYQQCKDKIKELNVLHKEYMRLLKNPNDIKTIFKDEVLALKKVKF